MRLRAAIIAVAALGAAGPASASELFAGLLAHGVDTPLTRDIGEGGADFELGLRSDPIAALAPIGRPSAYLLGSINSRGDTDFTAAGLSWRVARGRFYLRPGIGVAIHDGPSYRVGPDDRRTDLGSRVLFEPELSAGVRLARRASLEASWVHISHAQLFSHQNPGIDMIGVRAAWRLGR